MTFFTVERIDGLAVATFTRPPRNFMSFKAMNELEAVVTEVAADESSSVLMLTGGVDGYFVAHADLEDLARLGRGEPPEADPGAWSRTLGLLESMPQPVVAAINGQAWGGGCEISLACTLRIAAASAHMGQPEVNVGIIPGAGGTQRLPRLIGPGRAADLVLTGRIVQAPEALSLGIVNAVLPDESFRDAAIEWCGALTSKPRTALVAAKRALIDGMRVSLDEGLRIEGRLFVEAQMGAEAVRLETDALRRYQQADPEDRVRL
jgi:enoyl-CoA hydratase/carnithine racemase